MAEIVGAASLESLGIVGLVILFAVAMARGWLVTNTTHAQALQDLRDAHATALSDLREARDAALADVRTDRDAWRAAHDTTDARADVHTQQLGQMLEYARTSTAFIQAVSQAAGSAGGGHGTQ